MLGTRRATVNARAGGACTLGPMTSSNREAGRAPWIALAALLALVAGIAIAWQQTRPPRAHPPAGAAEPAGEAIEQALRQVAPIDSTAYKQRWLDEVRGVEVADLDDAGRELFVRLANGEQCTCGCGYTLAGCRASDMTCEMSSGRVQALHDSIRAGLLTGARGTRKRPRDGG